MDKSFNTRLVFACLCLAAFLAALDSTIVAVSLPTIVSQFGQFQLLSWTLAAYVLTSAAAQPLYGKMSDIYGRRAVLVAAILLFALGSILAGAAQNMAWLIGARALQGIGGGGIQSLTQVIIGDLVPAAQRGHYTGIMSGVFAVASVVGPVLGGAITSGASWRWIFYVNAPFVVMCLVLCGLYLQVPQQRVDHRLDLWGSLLVAASTSCLILAVTWGGNQYAWPSAVIVCLLVGSVLLAAAFVGVEWHVPEPIIQLALFRLWNFTFACAISALSGVGMFAAVSYLPIYSEVVQGRSPTDAGLDMLPMMAGVFTAAVGAGNLIAYTGAYRFWPAGGSLLAAVACGLLSMVTPTMVYGELAGLMFLLGLGLGMILSPVMIIVQNTVTLDRLAIATATAMFARTLGSAIGVAVYGAILNDHLTRVLPASLQPLIASGGTNARRVLVNDTAALGEFLDGYNGGISTVFAYAVVPLAASFVCGLWIRFEPLQTTLRAVPQPSQQSQVPAHGSNVPVLDVVVE